MADLTQALALWQGGRRLEAEREIERILRGSPDDPAALKSLAEIYLASDRTAQSIPLWRKLSTLSPTDAGVQRQLAQALLADRCIEEAIDVLRRAIALEPANARGHNNLGLALSRAGDAAGAAAALQQAVAVDPRYALGHMNLGLARQALGDRVAACASFERALQLDPHLAQARIQLSELKRATDAAAARRERDRALESHAINLMTARRHDEAIRIWTELIDSGADAGYAEGMRFHCRLHCCDWSRYEETVHRLEGDVRAGKKVDLPFSFFVHSRSPEAQLQCARTFTADRYPGASDPAPCSPMSNSSRIKIAYLSFDFHEHATAYLIAGLLECHDRGRFEVMALSYGENDGSKMRTRLEGAVEHFIDVSKMSDAEVAAWTRSEGVHIAVDLKGFTGGARTGIFASRAAPLQINFLGYPGTMGAAYFDYIIADRCVIPESDRPYYAEKVIYLPGCYQPNDAKRARAVHARDRTDYGLPPSGFVFCSFNNLYKITPQVFAVWLELLREIEGSVLWLLEGTASAMLALRTRAEALGIASERILFAPHIALADHLARYRHADLFLDSAPCNAHTTASDALWMAVPVLTMTGTTFAGRVATSLLHAVGLPQLCTSSLAHYKAKTLHLARSPAELAELKTHLERGRSTFPLFDTGRYCRELESAYALVWERHQRGEAPSTLAVPGSG